ncbi:AAA family ATPase [Iningainema tapete]|uniref:AAA family ATPase n=1 Tax=Iningainema tapete BLCC-T55 TaxID=2748662 RepID=A0A8J6XMW9_9CYAN|nr:AAA family ATPase [Iningainema tapete]MBD2774784.1 AAA family ATPase [Iningainema tapete BLCC-T55]
MLTRLKVSGFKNLVDVDVRFGSFTCVAGGNGVGKSNLFDAIRFLSAIADRPLIEAALAVRDEEGRTADVRSLFHRVGDIYTNQMFFDAEMIIPEEGVDDLGQKAEASITFLRYSITLAYRSDDGLRSLGSLEIIKEELVHINLGDAKKNLLFPHSVDWRKSAVKGRRTSPFISTEDDKGKTVIKLHQDGRKGNTLSRLAMNLPRTVLSVTNATESPTALLARREMQSWRLLQLEPSALRQPDEFTSPTKLDMDGSHLAATLYYLARFNKNHPTNEMSDSEAEAQVYSQIANRLAELIDDVGEVGIDRDERRELLTLIVTGKDGTSHPARALSDGTLRFLALAVLELDPQAQGLLCLEEPENGIHPERIPKILQLLQDIATDVDEPIGIDNPLRQVIVNTHSPSVVMQVPDDSLLVAELKEKVSSGQRFQRVSFGCLPETWRQKAPESVNVVQKNKLLAYLNPVILSESEPDSNGTGNSQQSKATQPKKRRVADRIDLQPLIPGFPHELA